MCICVGLLVLYHLVARAASIDGCLCLSGSLPLIFFCMLVFILSFEANIYDDDDDERTEDIENERRE